MSANFSDSEYEKKRKLLLPTLIFCILFFVFYYLILIIPKYGIDSKIFLIDNIGGSFVVLSFLFAIFLSKKIKNNIILMLPSFGTVAATSLFLLHNYFYQNVNHLWLSTQIIGIIFAIFLGTPKLNCLLLVINIIVPLIIASLVDYLDFQEIAIKQAIVYFASVISIYLSHRYSKTFQVILKSRDLARTAEKAKSEFLANMSHEIRTPMNGILGNAELLWDGDGLSKDQKKYAKNILDSSTAMLTILNGILDYSKIEAGHLKIEIRNFDLHHLISSVADLYEQNATSKNLYLEIKISENVPQWIQSDSNYIRQILSNLLNNAIKFTNSGGVTISVSASISQSEFELQFKVQDTGIGIAHEQQSTIFDSFSQADTSTTRKYGGTGLGLAICKKLVHLLGGNIQVVSSNSKGSIFLFYINASKGISSFEAPGETNSKKIDNEISELQILVVDDNAMNRDLVVAYLKAYDIIPEIAVNGKEALEQVKLGEFDIIFMDCQMPIMDGYESAKEIRKLTLDKNPIIIALTANAMEGDSERCISVGMDDYIAKPVSKKKLVKVIQKWVENSRDAKVI